MKDFYKNPVFYYILVPVLAALWPLSAGLVYLPKTKTIAADELLQHQEAQMVMEAILDIDPGRLDVNSDKAEAKEFDYATAVGQIADSIGISSASYTIDSQQPRISNERKTKTATVILQKVDIEKFADFLSSIQRRWANLECESVDIDRQKGLTDAWKVTLKFKYYY
jgi:hypothetical protein